MVDIYQKKILLIDDNASIHEDFRKILNGKNDLSSTIAQTRDMLFGSTENYFREKSGPHFIMDSAYQGEEGVDLVKKAINLGEPYALAFVDIRMPPGLDGIATIQKLWEIDPEMQMVICSAHSDYSWEDIAAQLNCQDNLLILKKPFDIIEVRQLASAMVRKWELKREIQFQLRNLENEVKTRTSELQKLNEDLDEALSLTKDTIESTQEGLLVLDKEGNILIYNQKFLELWGISDDLIHLGKSTELLQKIALLLEESDTFLARLLSLCKNPKTSSIKELKLLSGQVFELYLHSRYVHNKSKGIVLSFRDVTENKRLEQELLHQATHDTLTGLPNRIILMDRLQQAIQYAKRNNLYVGILMLDLDNFKRINDTLGHKAGDKLLNLVAQKLKSRFRESDTITRFGGDEFVIILPTQAHHNDFSVRSEKLKKIFDEPFTIEGRSIILTGSMGISVYPLDGQSPDDLLKNADVALYYAKDMGKNNFQFYDPEFNENLLKRVELEADLQQGLKNNEFILHYQPLLNLNSNNIIGVEALLRWKHPKLGLLSPSHFIPLAEKTGLIIQIGNWVLKTACLQAKIWQAICPDLSIAVNVSGSQILQKEFIKFVKQVLKETKLPPQTLELEITENIIIENTTYVPKAMKLLKDMGVKLSMDDFGIGYSSLNYVKYFPFDKIKIDKSFTQGISSNMDDKNIVEAIINMTKSMGLVVLAEGVETKEQIDFLRLHHSNQIQGYYISRPLDNIQFSDFLKNFKPSDFR